MPNVILKSEEELSVMREAGRLLALVFRYLDKLIVPGISTMDINHWAERYIVDDLQARPASKGQYDYQYVLNASVNHVVCHGIPSATKSSNQVISLTSILPLRRAGLSPIQARCILLVM
ncbi:hypothetical protein HORIV_28760 [Vreelandella olivaria]|uniref:Peptidase M24 domain-containing protein n=1 Tax=Vreelandella olivaria TaxID=390919 RepID=A0ABM7GII1_9GAMM|nr:hypothetical protein HORIV_28760 [Halomonas olivaria]